MIYLKLFLTFLEIGAVSFGGGYGMISLIREAVISNGWMTEGEFLNFIAVSESTPGPLAVNIATFVGSSQGGFLGALMSTLGVILPSFIIILIIASVLPRILKYSGVKAFLGGVHPCITALIFSTAVIIGLGTMFGFKTVNGGFRIDLRGILIFILLISGGLIFKHFKKKMPSPILMILISAGLGLIFYSI